MGDTTKQTDNAGLTEEQLKDLTANKAPIIDKNTELNGLPEEIRKKIEDKIIAENQKSEQLLKDQFYAKLKEQNKQIQELLERQKQEDLKIQQAEEEKKKLLESEATEKMTLGEKIKKLEEETKKTLTEQQRLADEKLNAISQQLHLERMMNLRNSLIEAAGGKEAVFEELIPTESSLSAMTADMLVEKVAVAKQKRLEAYEKLKATLPPVTAPQVAVGQGKVIDSGTGHLSSTVNIPTKEDLSKLSRDEFKKASSDYYARLAAKI